MSEEDNLFAEAMGKVQPLSDSGKIEPVTARKRKPRPQPRSLRPAHSAASAVAAAPSATDDPWTLVADGVSRERLRRLAQGRPAVDITLDLHGVTRDEALAMLAMQFGELMQRQGRVARIIHGRGLHSQGRPVLKEAVYRWLREGSHAASVLAAIPEPGSGGGACLVLLRKASQPGV